LILRADMPRSLHHCYEVIINTLDELSGKKQLECRRMAGQTYAQLRYGRIDKIFKLGLHEFLTASSPPIMRSAFSSRTIS